MDNKWYEIWAQRQVNDSESLTLENLIALDGFDSGAGKIEVNDWREYTRLAAEKLNIKESNSVYEVGCGSGAFLYALSEHISLNVGGNDYSDSLIKAAKQIFPKGDFECLEARSINTSNTYDFVISNSVFHYFDLTYGKDVLKKMIEKAKHAVCILEVPDINTKEKSERIRREMLSAKEYESKYSGLQHTYYDRDWFISIAVENGLTCEIFDGFVPNYAQNKFRFGCIMRKSS